jgi:phosphate transport system protein
LVGGRRAFDKALKDLQQEILRMGSFVEEVIANSVLALAKQDVELADRIIAGDDLIDQAERDIQNRCLKLIATQQPMAKDLRRIAAGFKIIIDLERMADNACDIAKVAKRIAGQPLIKPLIDIPRMAEITQGMVKDGLDSYVRENVDLALTMCKHDDEVDHLYSQVFRELLVLMLEDPKKITQATHLMFVARYLERIADHATNIGEEVVYLVTGERKELND